MSEDKHRMLVYLECAKHVHLTVIQDVNGDGTADQRERFVIEQLAARYVNEQPEWGIAVDLNDPRIVRREVSAHVTAKVHP